MLILSLLMIFVFRGIPLLIVLVKSLIPYSQNASSTIFSFTNYRNVIDDEVFWDSLANSFFLLAYIPILLVISFIMAMIIHDGLRIANIYKTIIVFPQIVSTLIIASIFGSIFGYNGPVNSFLGRLSILPVYWLGEKIPALGIIIICIVYSMFGWQTLILSSALSTTDPNIKSLTLIDGVGFFRRVIIYMYEIKKTITLSLVLNTIYGFAGYFPIIYTLTKGGPAYETTTIDYLIYLRAFKYGKDLSTAYATAALLFFIVLILIYGLFALLEKRDSDENNKQ